MKKRITFWALLVTFVISCVVWVLHEPYRRGATLRAIPGRAEFVSVHKDVAGRWDDICASPLMAAVTNLVGPVGTDGVLEEGSATWKWFHRLAGREIVFAYVSRMGGMGYNGRLLASWIGGYAHVIGRALDSGLVKGVTREGEVGGRPVWRVPVPSLRHGLHLSIAVVDGMLLGCVSVDRKGVRHMLRALDGTSTSFWYTCGTAAKNFLVDCKSRDRAWTRLPGRGPEIDCNLELLEVSASSVSGRAVISTGLCAAPSAGEAMDLKGLRVLLGDVPITTALLSVAQAKNVMQLARERQEPVPTWLSMGVGAIDSYLSRGDAAVAVCMLEDEYRGRLKSIYDEPYRSALSGIAVPTLITVVEIEDAGRAEKAVMDSIDRINAKYGLGLVPHRTTAGDYTVVSVTGTMDGMYGQFRKGESAAYAICGKWLVIGSNTEGLLKLVARYQRDGLERGATGARWARGIEDETESFAWADLESTVVSAKDIIAVWRLALGNGSKDARMKYQLKKAERNADVVRALSKMSLQARSYPQSTRIDFVFGQQ